MVRLTRIYTRGGDGGETSLGDGARVPKHALRVEAYGTVDEANAVIGIARLHAGAEADEMLGRIQNDLFDLGADLCTPEGGRRGAGVVAMLMGVEDLPDGPALRFGGGQALLMIEWIDRQRLAGFLASDQIIEVATGVCGPDLFNDHHVPPSCSSWVRV